MYFRYFHQSDAGQTGWLLTHFPHYIHHKSIVGNVEFRRKIEM